MKSSSENWKKELKMRRAVLCQAMRSFLAIKTNKNDRNDYTGNCFLRRLIDYMDVFFPVPRYRLIIANFLQKI